MLHVVPHVGSTFCGTGPDSEWSLSEDVPTPCGRGELWTVTKPPHVEGQTSSHLHFLEDLKPFHFADAVVIQVNILKQNRRN